MTITKKEEKTPRKVYLSLGEAKSLLLDETIGFMRTVTKNKSLAFSINTMTLEEFKHDYHELVESVYNTNPDDPVVIIITEPNYREQDWNSDQ